MIVQVLTREQGKGARWEKRSRKRSTLGFASCGKKKSN